MTSYPAPSLDEAKRGIYIDFEGRPTHHPALLGSVYSPSGDSEIIIRQVLIGTWPDQHAVERVLSKLPPEGRLPIESLRAALDSVLTIAESEGRCVLSYSQHELRMIAAHAPDMLSRATVSFRDAKKGLKRWWYRKFSAAPPKDKHRLQKYLTLLGCGDGSLDDAKFVGGVISGFERLIEGTDQSLPSDFGTEWLAALRKNHVDCEGLRCCTVAALTALE